MHPATLAAYRNLRGGAGGANNFLLWTPSLVAGEPDRLVGRPVYTSTGVAVQASLAYIVYYGDFREAYTIVDRVGMNIIRDNITLPGRVKFHTYRRSAGAVVNFQAMKMIRCTV
jgi:HK97 family phage major capsid protein